MAITIFDTSKRSEKALIQPGTVITIQGKPANALILLHSGMAELLDCPGETSVLPAEAIVAAGLRVGLIKGESVCGVSSFTRGDPERWSIRALSECQVSVLPITSEGMLTSIQSKRGLALQVLRATQQCIESAIFLFNNYKYLWHKLASISDAIALATDWSAQSGKTAEKETIPNRLKDALPPYSRALRSEALRRGLPLPEPWDPNLFLDRLQEALGRYSDRDGLLIESCIDNPQYLFLKRLVKRSDDVLLPLFEKDEPLQFYIFQFLSRALETVLPLNRELAAEIRQLTDKIYGKDGWAEKILTLPEVATNTRIVNFLHYLWRFTTRCQTDMQKLLDISLEKNYPSLTTLSKYHESVGISTETSTAREPVATPTSVSAPVVDRALVEAASRKYANLASRLLEFSELDEGFVTKFKAGLAALKQLPDKLSTEKPAQEIRQRFSVLYWRLYEICFLKVINSDLKSPIPGIMLHFGLVDETLVRPEDLALIDGAYARALAVDTPIPVMTLPYFLEKIFTGTVNPSLSEMGESFPELLRRQEKMTNKEKDAAELFDDSPEGRVRYEISQIANPLSRLLSGARNKSLPVLCSENLVGSLLNLFLDPVAVAEFIQSIRERDFTIFFREVVLKHSLGTDLIRKEVMPNIVLYPAVGSRGMMWQELDGTRKDSAGRIFIPLFFTDKRDETITELLAFLRWELARASAGYNWMDPTEGGLAGSYYDYISYYKKNPDLSTTAKDALKEFIARTRSERDRFAEDYRSWVLYEYESKVRLNQVARSIFYRFCPFPKSIRETMAKKPMFTDLETKYKNRARKDLLALESRIRKFEKANTALPPEITAWQTMLNG